MSDPFMQPVADPMAQATTQPPAITDIRDTLLTPAAMQSHLAVIKQQGEQLMSRTQDFIPKLHELNTQAEAADKSFMSQSEQIMQENDAINKALVKSEALPGGLANLVGIFDSSYNPEVNRAKLNANNSRLANAYRRYEVTKSSIGSQTTNLRSDLEATKDAFSTDTAFFGAMIQGYNATRESAKVLQEENINFLAANPMGDLDKLKQNAVKSGSVDYKGRSYSLAEIDQARTLQSKTQLSLQQMGQAVNSSILGNKEKAAQLAKEGVTNYAIAIGPTKFNDLIQQPGNGPIKITGIDGQSQMVDRSMFISVGADALQSHPGVRSYLDSIAKGSTEAIGELESARKQAELALALPGDPTQVDRVIGANLDVQRYSNLASSMQSKIQDPKFGQPDGPKLTTEELGLYTGRYNEQLSFAVKSGQEAANKAMNDYEAALPKTAQSAYKDMRANGGRITTTENAAAIVHAELTNPNAFGFSGDREPLNTPFHATLENVLSPKAGIFDKNGALKDSSAFITLMTQDKNIANDPQFAFLKTDDTFKRYGGLKGAIIANDLTQTITKSLVNMRDDMRKGGATTTPIDDLIQGQQLSPTVRGLIGQMSPIGAVERILSAEDARAISQGEYNVDNTLLSRFYTQTLSGMRAPDPNRPVSAGNQPRIQLDIPPTLGNAMANYVAYNNNPASALRQIIAQRQQVVATTTRQAIDEATAQTPNLADIPANLATSQAMTPTSGQMDAFKQNQTLRNAIPVKKPPTRWPANPFLSQFSGYRNDE